MDFGSQLEACVSRMTEQNSVPGAWIAMFRMPTIESAAAALVDLSVQPGVSVAIEANGTLVATFEPSRRDVVARICIGHRGWLDVSSFAIRCG